MTKCVMYISVLLFQLKIQTLEQILVIRQAATSRYQLNSLVFRIFLLFQLSKIRFCTCHQHSIKHIFVNAEHVLLLVLFLYNSYS